MCTLMQNPVSIGNQGSTNWRVTSNRRPLDTWRCVDPARAKDRLRKCPCLDSRYQLRQRLVENCPSDGQLNRQGPSSSIQRLSVLNQNLRVITSTLVRGTDS